MGFKIDGIRMGCSCAHRNEYGYQECAVSGDRCVYAFPNAWKCADQWGEGPCVIPTPDDEFGLEDLDADPDIRVTFEMSQNLIDFLDKEDVEFQRPVQEILQYFEDYTKESPEKLIIHGKEIFTNYNTDPEDNKLYHFSLDLKGD